MNMATLPKFFSRKEKSAERKGSGSMLERAREMIDSSTSGWDVFYAEKENPDNNPHFKAMESLIPRLRNQAAQRGILKLDKGHLRYALRSQYAGGDVDKACELLLLIRDSVEGIIKGYNPNINLLGAQNRDGVTCYLDALLFAMFVRLDCFEIILYNTFEDEPRRNLSCILRLWVNMLRIGKLIHQDIAKQLQDALAACGWKDAALKKQQDTSEAFSFITEKLELPLLTLKMDIYHTGKEEAGDDHRFVNERLLNVAIPADQSDGPVKLETCLESYFSSRIDVKRRLGRCSTLTSIKSFDSLKSVPSHSSATTLHNNHDPSPQNLDSILEMSRELKESLISQTGPSESPAGRDTSQSLVRERFFSETEDDLEKTKQDIHSSKSGKKRKGSVRKEVMMPAWQVFSLIPWYTDNRPTSDPELAVHFSEKRPILGICLKRYANLPDGRAVRLSTFVDIPIEIGLPHFIQDDLLEEDGPLFGNFKLSLQAVVCHKGNSIESGHYISLARGTNQHVRTLTGERPPSDSNKYWLRFDNMGAQRVTLVDIEAALKDEAPYLLFYQILPIEADENSIEPPPYTEIDENMAYPMEKGTIAISSDSSEDGSYTKGATNLSPPSQLTGTTSRTTQSSEGPVSDTNHSNNLLYPSRNNSIFRKHKSKSRPESIIGDISFGASLNRWRRRSADPLVSSENRSDTEQNKNSRKGSLDLNEVSTRMKKADTPTESKKEGKQPDRECVLM